MKMFGVMGNLYEAKGMVAERWRHILLSSACPTLRNFRQKKNLQVGAPKERGEPGAPRFSQEIEAEVYVSSCLLLEIGSSSCSLPNQNEGTLQRVLEAVDLALHLRNQPEKSC